MSIVITGHTGFVGKALVEALAEKPLRLVGRRALPNQPGIFFQKNLDAKEDYTDCLTGASVVIHTAARVHVMDDTSADPLNAYRSVNVDATLNFARQAALAGVKRFIFISSIKVNGEGTGHGIPYTADDKPAPMDPYGVSKAEAEQQLLSLAASSGMELVIVRPPLVYGFGVKANFAAMLKLAKRNLPMPLGAINNRRSLVALDNLVHLIKTCIDHPKAANEIFLVSDDRDVSTSELIVMMVKAYGKTPWLIPVPVSCFKVLGKLTGKEAVISRLCGDLQVDITKTKELLDWSPVIAVEDAIKLCIPKEDLF